MATIENLSAERGRELLPQLGNLLQDGVESGASIGFMLPLTEAVLQDYWQRVLAEVEQGSRLLWGAWVGDQLAGTLQLELVGKPNAPHRAEVQKLIVLRAFRGQGIAKKLMAEMEKTALERGRFLLILDTETESGAETLYKQSGYQVFGIAPQYADTPDGRGLISSTFFYKLLR